MKSEFLKPRFTGARFDEHTLPVEVARDLAAYEELVIELAKALWIAEHPGRERVPRGFEKEFSLHLEGMIEEGSARPLLSCVVAGALALQGGGNGYFGRARDLIAESIIASAAGQALPSKFPKYLLNHFNVFGRSLREGESMEMPFHNDVARLTPERRKKLVLDGQRVYSKDVELTGCVAEVDWEKQTFRLRLSSGSAVPVPLPDHFRELVRQAGGIERTRVLIKGVGVFDAYDQLQKLSGPEHLELQPNQVLADQLDELSVLQDGWFDGLGIAPDKEGLSWASDHLVSSFPEDLQFPHVGPTPEGGLFLEWIQSPLRVSAEILFPSHECELQATNTTSGETINEVVNLDHTQAWLSVYSFVREHLLKA